MTTIVLSTIGSRGVTVDVGPAALPEAGPGGVALELGLHDGPLVVTLTADEAKRLVCAVADVITPGLFARLEEAPAA